jgi:hypothetical protein
MPHIKRALSDRIETFYCKQPIAYMDDISNRKINRRNKLMILVDNDVDNLHVERRHSGW